MIKVRPPTNSAETNCQRNVKTLRRGLGHHLSLADPQVVDLGEQMIQHSGVLTHRTLRLTGRPTEVDVGQLIRRDQDAQISSRRSSRGRLDEEPFIGQRRSLVQRGGAAGFGLPVGIRPGRASSQSDRPGSAARWAVHTTSLEDRKNGSQPIQIALGHHRHHTLTA